MALAHQSDPQDAVLRLPLGGKPLELCLWRQKLQLLLNQLQMQLNQTKLLPQIHQSPFFIFRSGWDLPEVRNNTHVVSADLRLGHVGCD